jgi:uncharacterized membrane protein
MKIVKFFSCLLLLVMMVSLFFVSGLTLAQEGEPSATDNVTQSPPEPELISEEPETPPDTITLSTEFPKVDAIATGSFEFTVKLEYKGEKDRVFDLNAIVPAGWDVYINPQYETKKISSITIESAYGTATKNLKVTATPPTWPLADPGEYKVTLEASSDEVIGTIDLTAKITAKYILKAASANELLNTTAKAGKDNTYSIIVTNMGTAPIDNITFSSVKSDQWEVTFKPDKIDLLEVLDPKTIDVNIKPAPKTVAGDYNVTLYVSGKQASADKMDVRVSVEPSTVWGWVGVAIIIIVIAGLVYIFMRFGRR